MSVFERSAALAWIPTIVIGIVTFLLAKFWINIKRFPRGPFPFPVFGNLLSFALSKFTPLELISWYRRKYGDVMTIWFGQRPFVFVSSWEQMRIALVEKKEDFNGRAQFILNDCVVNGADDIVFSDSTPSWRFLRKLGSIAVRKYSDTEGLATTVNICAKEAAQSMIASSQDKAIDPFDPIRMMVIKAISKIAFGSKVPENISFLVIDADDCFQETSGNGFASDFIPMLRPFFRKKEDILREKVKKATDLMLMMIREHMKTYEPGEMRDFVDSLLASKAEAREGSIDILTDDNLKLVMENLFFASLDTTHATVVWLILFLAYYPEVQERMHSEIVAQIGDGMAVQTDKTRLPYTWAAISEILRIRAPVPFLLPHKAKFDTELDGLAIPAETTTIFNVGLIHMDKEIWPEPESFKPERFLDADGELSRDTKTHYAPFGLGKRSCIGEKLARLDIFFTIVALLQDCRFELFGKRDPSVLKLDDNTFFSSPVRYKVFVKARGDNRKA